MLYIEIEQNAVELVYNEHGVISKYVPLFLNEMQIHACIRLLLMMWNEKSSYNLDHQRC